MEQIGPEEKWVKGQALRDHSLRHHDLRTANKVLQTLQAEESGQSGLPSPAIIISD